MMKNRFKVLFIILVQSLGFQASFAQKLPNIQRTNLRAPNNIKIDGKLLEWNNKLQAYNKSTDLFYTISNDDRNLYLTVQATDPDVINKIVGGGITLVIAKTKKKNDKNQISITFPVTDKKVTFFNLKEPQITSDPATASHYQTDSIVMRNNSVLSLRCKYIGIRGIKDLDSLISAYNNEGVKAAILFDNKKSLNYELSINLGHLNISIDSPTSFFYRILVNGSRTRGDLILTPTDDMDAQKIAELENMANRGNAIIRQQSVPTDLWGEYTLAKKP